MTKVSLEIILPFSNSENKEKITPIKCKGAIVRIEPIIGNFEKAHYNIAVFFTEISDKNKNLLSEFVEAHLDKTDQERKESVCKNP